MRRLKRLRGAALLVTLLFGAGIDAHDEEDAIVPETIDELLAAISDVLEATDTPGVALAIVNEDGPEYVGALGKADVENDIDADADTLFRIGSTSKMFVALSVLQLVEDGRLSLDDRLADLAPEVEFENPWADTHPVRIVHLLEHTTGWDENHLPQFASNDPTPITLKEAIDLHPHSRKSRWPPGTRMSYCNAGPPIAAYVLQKITGQDFEDYVQANFFTPLGMSGATYRQSEAVQQRGATLYVNGKPQEYRHIAMRPSGAVNVSGSGMANFLQLFLGRGTHNGVQYLEPASLERMEVAASTNGARAGLEIGYGLHNYTSTHDHWTYQGHRGAVPGGQSELAYLPDAGRGYVFMINSGSRAALGDIRELIRDYQTRDLDEPEMSAAMPRASADRDIAGLYQPINSRQQVGYFLDRLLRVEKLWFERGELHRKRLLGGERSRYLPAGDGKFRSRNTGRVALVQTKDPLAGTVLHAESPVLSPVLKPVSPLVGYGQLAIGALWIVSIVTSFVYLPIWGVRRWRGKVPAGPATRIRVWPLLASVSAVAFIGLFAVGLQDAFDTLGKPTVIAVTIMLGTLAFAVFAVLGAWTAVRERRAEMNRVNYWYSSISSGLHLLVALYLGWFGIIGLQTWT